VHLRCPCRTLAAAAGAVVCCLTPAAHALINPRFTPVDLARQAALVLPVEIEKSGDGLRVTPGKPLKGEPPAKLSLRVDAADGRAADGMRKALRPVGPTPALLFVGDFAAACREGVAGTGAARPGAALVGANWFGLLADGPGSYRLTADELDLKAVWAGGALMLGRAVRYALDDPAPFVPVRVGARWAATTLAGTVPDAVGCLLVTRGNPASASVLVLSPAGDRLLVPVAGRRFRDGTQEAGLTGASLAAAWADFDGDGQEDIATWDGKLVRVRTPGSQDKPGAVLAEQALGPDCLGLAIADFGQGRRGVLCGTSAGPRLLIGQGASAAIRNLEIPPAEAAAGRTAGPAIVADLDADGLADVAQPDAAGLLLFRGKGGGDFDPARRACRAALRGRPTGLFATDADTDGLLDLVVTGPEGPSLFWNRSGGAIVYLNGKEIARAFLPAGAPSWSLAAEPYGESAFFAAAEVAAVRARPQTQVGRPPSPAASM
jgi:hypothetical protein